MALSVAQLRPGDAAGDALPPSTGRGGARAPRRRPDARGLPSGRRPGPAAAPPPPGAALPPAPGPRGRRRLPPRSPPPAPVPVRPAHPHPVRPGRPGRRGGAGTTARAARSEAPPPPPPQSLRCRRAARQETGGFGAGRGGPGTSWRLGRRRRETGPLKGQPPARLCLRAPAHALRYPLLAAGRLGIPGFLPETASPTWAEGGRSGAGGSAESPAFSSPALPCPEGLLCPSAVPVPSKQSISEVLAIF
ncbi:basic proline-rich protein-like [Pan paniscus]|uniref:basic proline-rich protein-like n=1 Tax=Pan paniscus TaxID=9597 RepID=UPI002546530F|nr:basic proline-rich protein-like [Pan paniscus]